MASQLPNGRQTFYDENGDPLVNGKVYFYIPNTTTPKDTWQDADETILNANPIVLDSLGSAVIFGSGAYRQILEDSLANQIWDQLTYSPGTNAGGGTGTAVYDTKATVEALTVPLTIDVIEILGHTTPFDNGGATYQRSGALPSHNGYIQDDSGAIFVLQTEIVCMEMFGGFPGGGSVTAAWNDMLGYAYAANKWQGQAFEGVYTFSSKPNAVDFNFAFKGKGRSKTTLLRNYSEATNADAFYNIIRKNAGVSTNGCQLESISLIAATGTSNGIMLQATTEGLISGFYTFNDVNITYSGTGQFDICVNLDGMLNTTLGGQGIRDVTFKNASLFAPTAATYAFKASNAIALNAELATFGASANAGVFITGGTAANDADKSQDCRLDLDCIGTLTVDHAKRVNSWGDVKGIIHGTLSEDCTHFGTVGTNGYSQDNLYSDNFCIAPTIAPLSPEAGTLAGFRNRIINGGMDVDQRNNGAAVNITNSWQYGLDRWGVVCGAAPVGTLTMQRVSGANLSAPFAVRIARSAGVFGQNIAMAQPVETRNVWPLVGRRVTVSFKARKGSNFQGANFSCSIITGTGSDQGITGILAGTWTGWANVQQLSNIALTTSEQKFVFTTASPILTNVREIGILFDTGVFSGTGDANDWVEITEVQLEAGAVDPLYCQFERSDITVQLDMCKRYCVVAAPSATIPIANGVMTTTTSARVLMPCPEMRVAPTVVITLATVNVLTNGSSYTPSAVVATGVYAGIGYMLNFTTAVATANHAAVLVIGTPNKLILDAELN